MILNLGNEPMTVITDWKFTSTTAGASNGKLVESLMKYPHAVVLTLSSDKIFVWI